MACRRTGIFNLAVGRSSPRNWTTLVMSDGRGVFCGTVSGQKLACARAQGAAPQAAARVINQSHSETAFGAWRRAKQTASECTELVNMRSTRPIEPLFHSSRTTPKDVCGRVWSGLSLNQSGMAQSADLRIFMPA